ncbi:hypothetical protein QPM17_00490 [Marinobacter sp. TBZ242]|uniref:Uncharacterized protein n=1 Tax=Marinobacter azerbaijanicus TaxID=3050455 RepID=A0ABT7I677_9GAMM|nr:hypothetical protein [Marinobacter sp. TBZ242]MDL0429589.1 hypothetical protein [Marinobacter sp. TBZ242]
MQKDDTTPRDYTFNAAEVLEHRQLLMDIELLLNPFQDGLYNEHDSCQTQIVGAALAKEARSKLMDVCEWMEWMEIKAEKMGVHNEH